MNISERRRIRTAAHLLLTISLALAWSCRENPRAAKQRYLESGNRYAAAGKYAEAIIEYRNALQQDSAAADVRVRLADAYVQTGDLARALGEYVRAADLQPDNVPLQVRAGSFLLLAGRFDDAKARAEKVLARDSRNVDAQVIVANALAGLKDVDAAIAQIEDAVRVDPDRSTSYSNLGALELLRGDRPAARRAFEKAIELQPRSITAHLALANFFWANEEWAATEQSLKRALDLDPRNTLANRALASFYLATNRRSDAEKPLKVVFDVTRAPAAGVALSEYYISMGNDGAARAILEPMRSDPRIATEAEVRLAGLEYKTGHREEASRRLGNVLTKDPVNLQALLAKSTLLLADRNLDEALATVNVAKARHPNSTAAMFLLGRVQSARNQPDEAIAAFQEVLRLNPRATDAKIALAQLHLAQGRPDSSMVFAQEALANEPANATAQLVLVRGLLSRGELDRADTELKQLVARFPGSPAVHTEMGILFGRRHDYAAARAEFERALQLQADALEPLAGLVALDLTVRDYAQAKARVDARVVTTPTAAVLTLAGRAYAASGDLGAAERFLRRAIDADSRYLAAYGALGQLYVAQGRLDRAKTEFETLSQRLPRSVSAQTMTGLILQMQGDVKGARERFERALQIDPEAAVAANNLAWIYADTGGNLDLALQLAQTAKKRLPDLAEVNDTLGFIYYKKDLTPLAIAALRLSVEKDSTNPLFQFHLGLAYAKAGNDAAARTALTRALSLKPDFEGADEARQILAKASPRS